MHMCACMRYKSWHDSDQGAEQRPNGEESLGRIDLLQSGPCRAPHERDVWPRGEARRGAVRRDETFKERRARTHAHTGGTKRRRFPTQKGRRSPRLPVSSAGGGR